MGTISTAFYFGRADLAVIQSGPVNAKLKNTEFDLDYIEKRETKMSQLHRAAIVSVTTKTLKKRLRDKIAARLRQSWSSRQYSSQRSQRSLLYKYKQKTSTT